MAAAPVTMPSRSKGKDSERQSSLFEACKNGDLERVKKFLTPENVNSRDTAGRKSTPLHFAAGKNRVIVYLYSEGVPIDNIAP